MKFTIGTVSSSLDFSEDLKLIKSALLYADEIELIGMVEYAVYKYLPHMVFDVKDMETMLTNIIPFFQSIEADGSKELLPQLEYVLNQMRVYASNLKKKKRRSKEEILIQMQLKKVETECREQLSAVLNQLLEQPGSQEIENLVKRKLISVYDYGFSGFSVDELSGGYFANIMNAMYNRTAYPLFDNMSSDFIGSLAESRILDIGHLDKEVLRHAGVASGILMTLPTLESATVDELVALKEEHKTPLANFRKAMYDFSEKIQSLPWSVDFQYDCIKLYNTEVVPKVQEINEVMTETSVLKNLGRRVLADEEVRKAAGRAAAGLTTAITTSASISEAFDILRNLIIVAGVAGVSKQALTGFLKTANLYNQAKQEVREVRKETEKNVMYYYYLASKIKC